MIYAVYRCLYEDHLNLSIASMPDVDKVFVFWGDRPWGHTMEIDWKGETVDLIHQRAEPWTWPDPRIVDLYDHRDSPVNQFTLLANERIFPEYGVPDKLLIMECDWVWRPDMWQQFLAESDAHDVSRARHVELWKTSQWRISQRPGRSTPVMWNLAKSGLRKIPPTKFAGDVDGIPILDACVHNAGFCLSPKTMLDKHLTALAFSRDIADSPPDPAWYDRWLRWQPGQRDLEISLGHAGNIPEAYPYHPLDCPEGLR